MRIFEITFYRKDKTSIKLILRAKEEEDVYTQARDILNEWNKGFLDENWENFEIKEVITAYQQPLYLIGAIILAVGLLSYIILS